MESSMTMEISMERSIDVHVVEKTLNIVKEQSATTSCGIQGNSETIQFEDDEGDSNNDQDHQVAEGTFEQLVSAAAASSETSQTHVASIQIPHLQLSNKDSNISNTDSYDGTDDDNQLRFHAVVEESNITDQLQTEAIEEHAFNNNQSLETSHFVESAATENPNTQQSTIELLSTPVASQDVNELELPDETLPVNNCSNCKIVLDKDSSNGGRESKNFHELLPHQYYNPFTGGHTDVQIVDALSEIFKIQWTCQNYAEIYKRDDLALCLQCASILTQLYKLYNEFSSLTIKSNAFLKKVINFQKDLAEEINQEYKNGQSSSPLGVFYNGNGGGPSSEESSSNEFGSDEEDTPAKTPHWKRKRKVKKVIRYGETKYNNSDFDEDIEFELNPTTEATTDKCFEDQSNQDHPDASVNFNNSIDEDNLSSKKNSSSLNEQVNIIKREHDVSDYENDSSLDYMVGLSKGEVEDTSNYVNDKEARPQNEYDENEPLHNVMQRISGFSLPRISEGQNLECQVCNKVFLFPIQLRIHINSQSHKEKSKRSNSSKSSRTKGPGCKKETPPVKICKCGKRFPTSRQLNRHMKTCTNFEEGGGKCDRCGKKFKTQGGLRIHYAAHKRDDSKYSCKDCGKKFRKMDALELHEKTDHGGFKPHACPQCDKCFRLKDKLKLHIMVIHEKRKPFPCPKCEKSFRTKYHLKIHDVSQHIQGGDNSIGCSQCKRKFADRDALEKHLVVHQQDKPYICSICSKGFQTTARLRLHEKSHQEVPSCLCPVCGRAYKHIRDLKLHEVVHQDESTYRFGCGDCPRRFYRIDLLRVHQSNEQHFSPQTIGPTVTKSSTQGNVIGSNNSHEYGMGTKGSHQHHHHGLIEDDEDDENETDSESSSNQHLTVITHPTHSKKAKMTLSNRKNTVQKRGHGSNNKNQASSSSATRDRDMTVMHPHATVIYHNPAMVHLQLDQSTVIQGSPGQIRTDTTTVMGNGGTANISNNTTLHLAQQQQPRYAHEIQSTGTTAYTIMNQRDARQTLHQAATNLMQGIQIQPVTASTGHPHIQFSNNTIYAMRDAAGNPTINISNVANPADTMQYDNIISFINNLG